MENVFDVQPPSSFVNTQSAFPVPLCNLFSYDRGNEQNNWFCFDDFFRKEVRSFKKNFLWKVFAPLFNQSWALISNQQHLSFRFLNNSIELYFECEIRSVFLSDLQIKIYKEYCALERDFFMTISANQKLLSACLRRMHWAEEKFREDLFTFYFYEIQFNHYMKLKKELQTLAFQKEETILSLWFAENANQKEQIIEEKEKEKQKQKNQKNILVATENEISGEQLLDFQNFFLLSCEEDQDFDSPAPAEDTKRRKNIGNGYEKKICAEIKQHIFLLQHLKSIESIIQRMHQSQQTVEKELKKKERHRIHFAHFFNEKVIELHLFLAQCLNSIQIEFPKIFAELGGEKRKKCSSMKESDESFFRNTRTKIKKINKLNPT